MPAPSRAPLSAHVPDLGSLELLLAVGRTGGLSAAGRELGLTQQAASARIRSVERRVGMRLLHRATSGSTLTTAGELLARHATGVLTAARELDSCIATLRGKCTRTTDTDRHQPAARQR